jgi:multiple sugar transport system permease protein
MAVVRNREAQAGGRQPRPQAASRRAGGSAGAAAADRLGRRGRGFGWYVLGGILISAVFVVPLLWEVFRSLQPESAVSAAPSGKTFSHLTFGNYQALLSGQDDILRNVTNSLIVAVAAALLTAVVSMLAGYGFAMFRFRGTNFAFGLVLLAFMIPFQAVLTPLFLEMHFLGLLNNLAGLVFFYTTFNLPVGVYVMRNSFLQVPGELVDAARVDGASVMRTLLSVYRPLIMPGIATAALYAFLFSWTEFLGALSFLTNDKLFTLPVALSNVETGTYGAVNYGLLLAGAVIAMIPCVIVYVSLQRYYVRGLVSGALKG